MIAVRVAESTPMKQKQDKPVVPVFSFDHIKSIS